MSPFPPKPKILALISVDEASSSLSSSSSSTSDGVESIKFRYDTATEVAPQEEDGARQRSNARESAACLTIESGSVGRKHEVASFLGHNSPRNASPGPGLIREGHKPHTYVSHQHNSKLYELWASNRSYLLVIIAVIFGSAMTLFTKLLEIGQHAIHPLRILFLRMSVTSILCFVPLYFKKDSGSPFGSRELRWLLVIRGITGFFGLCGIWMSISAFLEIPN